MKARILFVDDDQRILDAIKRKFRKKFSIKTALGAQEGWNALITEGPFAVVVSDLRMPEVDGVAFFGRLKKQFPEVVRIMLTGMADIEAAMAAVNKGQVFRFLTKPCPDDILSGAIEAGLAQHRLITAEKELLRGTLLGTIKVLTDLLSLVSPESFGRTMRAKRMVMDMGRYLEVKDLWRLELATMLSQIGCMTMPEDMIQALTHGQELTNEQRELFLTHPGIAKDLLKHIPRLDEVIAMIAFQEKRFDGSGPPQGETKGSDIPLGARILKTVLDLDSLVNSGMPREDALEAMRSKRRSWYDPLVFNALEAIIGLPEGHELEFLQVRQLKPGMILDQEVRTQKGFRLFSKGFELNEAALKRLFVICGSEVVKEPIRVLVSDEPQPTPPESKTETPQDLVKEFQDQVDKFSGGPPSRKTTDEALMSCKREFMEVGVLVKGGQLHGALDTLVRGLEILTGAKLSKAEIQDAVPILERAVYRITTSNEFKLSGQFLGYEPGEEEALLELATRARDGIEASD